MARAACKERRYFTDTTAVRRIFEPAKRSNLREERKDNSGAMLGQREILARLWTDFDAFFLLKVITFEEQI